MRNKVKNIYIYAATHWILLSDSINAVSLFVVAGTPVGSISMPLFGKMRERRKSSLVPPLLTDRGFAGRTRRSRPLFFVFVYLFFAFVTV